MDQKNQDAKERLALLLAGVPAAIRRALAEATEAPLLWLEKTGHGLVSHNARPLLGSEVPALLERLAPLGWCWIAPPDPAFPVRLKGLSDPPLGLFVKGRLREGPAAAVVGSRRATPYGLQVGRLIGRELGAAGVCVISGMARGIDAAAHEGAMEAGGPTVAVWGTGPDRVYPPEHGPLAEAIVDSGGALVTEFPPGTPPRRHHFPQRNRILAGLAEAVVVVEAAAKSGALNTARQALEEGRDVWAVPGSILSETSVGPNTLLRLGARPLVVPSELVCELGVRPAEVRAGSTETSPVLDAIPPGRSLSPDAISVAVGLGVDEVLTALLELELEGFVARQEDGSYARR